VQSHPGVVEAARTLTVPVLHLAAGRDTIAPAPGHVDQLAAAAGGPVRLRTLPKAQHTGFLDGTHWSDLLLAGRPDGKTRKLTRALVTAFLLKHLCDEDRVDVLVDGKVRGTVLDELGEHDD
jgi:pimeloyl-ACP methyl ester carboxylesterase